MNNGNVNNNNKNNDNNNYVLAVSEFQGNQAPGSPFSSISEQSVKEAYYRCLVHKKSTVSAVLFRVNEAENIRQLHRELVSGTWYPTTSIAFITENREVFAAAFRDRVVHTLVSMRIIPLLEQQFVPTTWNCRKGKGVLYAVQNLRKQIRQVSENYTRDAWVMVFDLSGFFMNINRERAADRLCRFIEDRYVGEDKDALLWLTRTIITHAPEYDCVRYGGEKEWETLPTRKSLFHCHGLPIGDLLSQLDGNFELDIFDHFITRLFASDRYVDDIVAVSADKQALLHSMPLFRNMLELTCGAKINPHKFKIVHWRDGFRYLGVIIHGNKAYTSGRTRGKAYNAIRRYNAIHNKKQSVRDFVSSINSYLGIMKHYNTDEIRKKMIEQIDPAWYKYVCVGDNNEKLIEKHPRRKGFRSELRKKRKNFNNLKYAIRCKLSEKESSPLTTKRLSATAM